MREINSTYPYCGVGCGVPIATDGERITGVRGDPDHPANFGRLCTKGATLHLTAGAGGRVLFPRLCAARGAPRERASWYQALEVEGVSMKGKVYLIGAGPGDVELLTLKAVRVLQRADVVLIDDLVNREVLRFLRPPTRVIEVGKRGGCKSTPQAFIERLMARFARRGCVVARLKGGDPFVFGRGGEEAFALARAGVACEVIPGITAGIGVPAALGIPVTHRDVGRGVTFLTGHSRDGSAPDWRALRATGTTLVIYMGMTRVTALVAGMLEAGFPADTPACAIQNGTLVSQRAVVTTLIRLPAAAVEARLGSPAILVIGEVVRYARTATALPAQRVA